MWETHAPFAGWALASVLLGLGFTFFSGATEAWLVDALAATGYHGSLDAVFGRGQIATGAAMLTGSVAGGFIAQVTNLGVPYVIRSVVLGLTLVAAAAWMRDLGFTPQPRARVGAEVKRVLRASIDNGFRKPPVRWLMLAALFSGGVGIYGFYASQPYLLQIYGDPHAFGIAGLAASLTAGAQMVAGLTAPRLRRLFGRRTHVLIFTALLSAACLLLLGMTRSLPAAIALLALWALAFSLSMPIRQAYLNGIIPSAQRATVLSFDNLMTSASGVVTQPVLGRVADVAGYGAAYLACAVIEVTALPFLLLARRERAPSDVDEEPRG
jgi:predicted MFS family arabinose efflux permease